MTVASFKTRQIQHGRQGRVTIAVLNPSFFCFVAAVLCVLSFSARAGAKAVQLQLVPYDQLNKNVQDLEKSRPLANPVSTPQGMVMKQVGVETVAWARNVLLDGKSVFERYVDGKYIGRSPVVDVDLEPGDHLIWPGNQQFTVGKDGAITSASPEFLIAGNVVKIRCYPLTVRAFRANPDEGDLPMSMRVAALPNLTIRDATDAEAKGERAMDLLPVFEKFSPLTLWLPANTVGKGYVIHPVGLTLHLTADGVKPAAGGGELIADLHVEKNLIDIPLYGYPIEGVTESGNRLVVPGVEPFAWLRGHGSTQLTNWYPRSAPYVLQLSEVGPTIAVDGDLRQLPFKRMAIDYSDRVVSAQRLVVVEAEARHLTAGTSLRARIRAVDTRVVSTAESAYKPALNELSKLMHEVAAAARKKADAQAQLTLTSEQIAAKTKQLEDPKLRPDRKKSIESELTALNAKSAEFNAAIAAASVETEPYDKKIEALKPIVADLKAKMQTFADANPLAEATVFAQIRSYDSGDWKDLKITPRSASREYDIAIPAAADGMYRLKVGVKGDDAAHRLLATESWVSIASARPYSIGLFTNRGRDSFYRGEGFWIGLGMLSVKEKIPAAASIAVDLVDSAGQRLPIFAQQTAGPVDHRRTIIIRIEPDACLSIAAGRYRVEARVGPIAARPLVIDIVDPEPRTHFTNLLNLKYNTLDRDYDRIVETGEGAEEFAQWIANLHYNSVVGLYYGLDRVVRHDAEIEQMVRERPELGPWESYYQPSGRDKIMSALLRRNIRFYEDIFTYNDTGLPRDPRFLDASARFISLETASMRFSPVFKGVCLYDEFYNTGDNGNVTTAQMNYAAQEVAYRAQYAREGYTSARALKALDRFTGRPFGQRDYADLAMFRTWQAHEDKDWAVFSLRMSGASKRVMPDGFNFTQQRFWGHNGANLGPNGVSDDVFQGLDAATCVSYKDGGVGERPVFPPMQADVLRVRDNLPVWTQLHDSQAPGDYGMHLFREAFFGLSQKVEGFIYFYIIHDPHEPSATDHFQFLKNLIGGVTEPYGDFLMSLDKGYNQVGIYYSRQSEYLSARKPNSVPTSCEGLWVACMRAGFPARFITDEELLAHAGDKYKVILFPGVVYEDETDPKVLKELQRLVDAGKTIIVEKSSKLPIERIVHADSEFDEYDDKLGGAFPRYEDHETDTVLDGSEETTKLLRQLLPKYAEPATESTMLFSPDWLKKGDGQYMVVSNFAPTKFTGLYKTLYQAPDMPAVRFPKRPAAAVYDVLEMKPVEVKTEGNWMTLSADLRDYPGKIYAFLPAAIAKVSLQCTPKVTGGRNIDYSVAVVDAGGTAINASFPIEITLTSPSGAGVFHINRAAAPKFTGVYRIASNAAPGAWKLTVRELISGAVCEASIAVEAGASVGGSEDTRPVWVHDAAKVKAFLADPTPAQIVVDREQAWILPQAQRLAAALTGAGKPTTVVTFEQAMHMPPDYDRMNPIFDGSRLWRGDLVQPGLFDDAPVILLGRRLESRLIEGIVRRDAVVESISADFPGPGRAIVAWAPLAFSTRFDSLLVMGQDEAALAKGVDELLAAKLPAAEIPIRQVTAAAPDPNASLAAAAPVASKPISLRHQIGQLDAVTSIDIDAPTGRVLVGTFGYGDNTFCFDAQGKLLWKTFLPEQNVYLARWYDGGKRILAATGRGPWIFMLDPANGAVLRKFIASEWPDGHGYTGFFEGQGDTRLQIEINPVLAQIIVGGRTGLLAVDFNGRKIWFRDRAEAITAYPAVAEQNLAACFSKSVEVGDFVLSPDGSRIAHGESVIVGSTPGKHPGTVEDLWAYRPMILDAKTGKVLASNQDDPGSRRGWSIAWPVQSPDPIVHFEAVSLALHPDGKLSKPMILPQGLPLPGGRFLHLAVSSAAVLDSDGNTAWSDSDEKIFPAALQSLSADRTRLFRCDIDGLLRCTNVTDGKTLWEHKLPFDGYPAALPDGGVVVGTTNGLIVRLDKSGKPNWTAALIDLQERPGHDYAAYIQSAVHRDLDNTGDFYPINHDQARDYDKVFRMGVEQLKNGSFESIDGWTSGDGEVKTAAPGKDSAKSLSLPTGQLVTQRLKHRIIPQGTYLLEFWYKVPDEGSRVVAGAMLAGEHDSQILTASKFSGRPNEWTFGRLAVKAMSDTKTIDIGFQSDGGGIVRVDSASFRPVRFPSANLLANIELQAIEPTFVRDLRVQYDRIPADVRERLMSRNHVAAYRQGPGNTATIFAQEPAFLHNGRIDDIGPFWFEPPDGVGFSAVLTKAAWISHVVLYLNNATPDNTYRFISIIANNVETKVPEQVALVRGNDRRFVVVKFDKPIFTDSIKVLPGFHGGHKECLTEVELYGPLGGPEVSAAGFPPDDQGSPMFMGNRAHVPTTLPADLSGDYALERQARCIAAYNCGPTVADNLFTWGNATGDVSSLPVDTLEGATGKRPPRGAAGSPVWPLLTVTPTSTPARYGGRLLVGSADYQLHAVSEQGVYLWGFKTGGRVYSSPLPDGDDVYFGSDDGLLYKIDLHSGMLLWEFETSGRIRSSPAMANGRVYVASWDGFLYAIESESGQMIWKSPLAPFTRSSPAIAGDRIYIGDESGQMLCFNAKDGALVWKQQLGGYISSCPLVTEDGALFVSEQGDAALVGADGEVKWKRNLGARVKGQPSATRTQALVPTSDGLMILKRSDGTADADVQGIAAGQVIGALVYHDKLCLIRASVTTDFNIPPRTYVAYPSMVEVWAKPKSKP